MDYSFGTSFTTEKKTTLVDQIESYLTQRRRQLQDWESNPPAKLSWIVFGLVVVELTLARWLSQGQSFGLGFFGEVIGKGLLLLILAVVTAKITDEFATYFNKKGSWKRCLLLFNLGLFPLLLFLPLTMLTWAGGGYEGLRLIVFFLLLLKVLANWRETIEITHELSRLQGTIVLYSALMLFFFTIFILVYVSLLKSASSFFSTL